MTSVVAAAPAKVNLRLKVHEREPSGYHRIQTVFCALELADELEVAVDAGRGVVLDVEGPDLGPADKNLAVRAAAAFLHRAGVERRVRIALRKRIPAGAGLGGGSSDAAAVLRALDRLLPDTLDEDRLHEVGRSIGSDVPFFLSGAPLAGGTGRGDVLAPLPPLPSRPVLLLIPPFPVSTSEAYRWLDEDRERAVVTTDGAAPDGARPASWDDAVRQACNDFEGPVFRRHPELRALREALAEAGALVALLSGSGSTVFGVFAGEDEARDAIRRVRTASPGTGVRLTATRS